jgi:hypothetical protein
MWLNIKDPDVERLATKVGALAGESRIQAVKVALQERKARLAAHGRLPNRHAEFVHFLETEVWPQVPSKALGRRMTKQAQEQILGFGSKGV